MKKTNKKQMSKAAMKLAESIAALYDVLDEADENKDVDEDPNNVEVDASVEKLFSKVDDIVEKLFVTINKVKSNSKLDYEKIAKIKESDIKSLVDEVEKSAKIVIDNLTKLSSKIVKEEKEDQPEQEPEKKDEAPADDGEGEGDDDGGDEGAQPVDVDESITNKLDNGSFRDVLEEVYDGLDEYEQLVYTSKFGLTSTEIQDIVNKINAAAKKVKSNDELSSEIYEIFIYYGFEADDAIFDKIASKLIAKISGTNECGDDRDPPDTDNSNDEPWG